MNGIRSHKSSRAQMRCIVQNGAGGVVHLCQMLQDVSLLLPYVVGVHDVVTVHSLDAVLQERNKTNDIK